MSRWLPLVVLLPACSVLDGQKVTVLLRDREIDCVVSEAGPRVARLTLDQEDDLYLAELVNVEGDEAFALEATRNGRDVIFDCPDGYDTLIVRHATVLQSRLSVE